MRQSPGAQTLKTFVMSSSSAGGADLFHLLESNKLGDVEETKKVFHEHFLSSKQ